MDLPIGPDRSVAPTLDAPPPEPASHGERLAAAVGADPIAQTQALVLREAYGAANVPAVLTAVHAGGPEALADLTQNPERYGTFVETPHARQGLTMLAGTLPNMDAYGGINAVLNGIPRLGDQTPDVDHARTGMEPRWGQLASPGEIIREMHRGLEGVDPSDSGFREQADILSAHFRVDRRFSTDAAGNVVEMAGSSRVDRYTYTDDYGWLDMCHVFYFASARGGGALGAARENLYMDGMTLGSETLQRAHNNPSAFSYEDLPSDRAGMDFAREFGTSVDDETVTMEDAMETFLSRHGGGNPERAPNFSYIPHRADHNEPKVYNYNPLVGERLRSAHRESYLSKTNEARNEIQQAHRNIRR